MANTQAAAKLPLPEPRQRPARLRSEEVDVAHDLVDYVKEYARQKPEVVALWCFGIGFILGWRLKPW